MQSKNSATKISILSFIFLFLFSQPITRNESPQNYHNSQIFHIVRLQIVLVRSAYNQCMLLVFVQVDMYMCIHLSYLYNKQSDDIRSYLYNKQSDDIQQYLLVKLGSESSHNGVYHVQNLNTVLLCCSLLCTHLLVGLVLVSFTGTGETGGRKSFASPLAMWASRGEDSVSGFTASKEFSKLGQSCKMKQYTNHNYV